MACITVAKRTRFCAHIGLPWKDAMRSLDIALVESYLLFHLNQKRCINGRRKRGTTKTQSLRTHWDSFRMLFKQEMLTGIDHQIEQGDVNNVSTPTPRLPMRRRLSAAGYHIVCPVLSSPADPCAAHRRLDRGVQAEQREAGQPTYDPREPQTADPDHVEYDGDGIPPRRATHPCCPVPPPLSPCRVPAGLDPQGPVQASRDRPAPARHGPAKASDIHEAGVHEVARRPERLVGTPPALNSSRFSQPGPGRRLSSRRSSMTPASSSAPMSSSSLSSSTAGRSITRS